MVHLTLYEKCKIAVWMEQFKCAEIVQLTYKKEFRKDCPPIQVIKKIHHLFMTTGSVLGNLNDLQDDSFQRKVEFKSNSQSEDGSNLYNLKECDDNDSEDIDEAGEINSYSQDMMLTEKNKDFVSILNEEISVEDKEYAVISVNESEEEMDLAHRAQTFLCVHCGYKTTNETIFESHQKAHERKDFFRCPLCTFTSNSTSFFRNHKKSCTGNNTSSSNSPNIGSKLSFSSDPKCYTCEQCGKAYSSTASLKMHQAYHSKLRPFACAKCDYRFFSEATLKKHLATHDKIKHLECPHCSFKSSMSGNMIIHARTHTGEKPYKCTECDYRTANPNVFRRHMGTHRNELIYRCRQCPYKTDKSSLLANHHKKHEDQSQYKCHFCQKQLKNSYALRYHLTKTHSEREVLECPFCDFRQKDKALLKMHIRRHTGEKPYECPEKNCNYRAIRSQDLKKHISKTHI